ncbi:alpha/beta hydrolase [Komarekiella sp. 'clone 1']|uniref:Alpha/beta hydrolase n=1 Tax=Komarekiella delphini-convector SJRDD-AB1 TaxID=2593771 RepID=A0AA40T2D1_9NOST|nr:alpha/beta hydrolase [Komarekiella delphini-convector]MBD6619643.1 alpha/beta hydrolase [Komarekiella delphini-convector SJRDD-AB1]
MSKLPDVLWLNTSPSLQYFAQPLLCYLSSQVTMQEWKYRQSQDEVSSLDAAVVLLHDYLKTCNRPVHLIGHSTAGLLGLLYSRRYPETVKSLTLLAVGVDAAVDWQAHYYTHRQFLSRQKLLTDMVYNLFGYQDTCTLKSLTHLLEQDLDCSLSPHSLFETVSMTPNRVSVPLMVCGSLNDIVVKPDALQGWRSHLKEGDRLWSCLEGWHFFHFFQYQLVAEQLLDFWKFIRVSDSLYSCLRL